MTPGPGHFPTTQTPCRIYRRPLYTYVFRHGYSTEEAED